MDSLAQAGTEPAPVMGGAGEGGLGCTPLSRC